MWQRPFIAGDALGFYLSKILVPIDLCVEYGRTPHLAMSSAGIYVIWAVPVGLLVFCYVIRRRRPLASIGHYCSWPFFCRLLGFVPFSYQAYSTVADRYAYLPMIGIGLVVATCVDSVGLPKIAVRVVSAVIVVLALVSHNQTSYWIDSMDFLHHTIDVNPNASFAHNNLGTILLQHNRADESIEHFRGKAGNEARKQKSPRITLDSLWCKQAILTKRSLAI